MNIQERPTKLIAEDFIFPRYPNGAGTQVETLPASQSFGELQDSDYFYCKTWRGLRIDEQL
jgi:hypothetical protein